MRKKMSKMPLKRFTKLFFFIICLSAALWVVLNLPVTSKQGVNYVVKTIKVPVYIKVIEFLDRNYHYQELTQGVTQGCYSEQDKVLAIFGWVHRNIKTDIPQGWPIIDDHVWHIVVRGYGVRDQLSDVFTTLCNYAGVDAFYTWVSTVNGARRIPLSLVKIEGSWRVFDPYHGCYFKNKEGEIADIEEIKSPANWSIENLDGKPDLDYSIYLDNLPPIEDMGLSRANIQSPLKRLLFEFEKLKKH